MVYNLNGVVISMDDNIAPQFSESTAYEAGAYVLKLQDNGANVLYKFTSDHAAGAWTGTDAQAVTMASELTDVKSQIAEKADAAGPAPYLAAGDLISSDGKTDQTPYLTRPVPADASNNMALQKIVGGTLAWNQLVDASTSAVVVPSGHKYFANLSGAYSVSASGGKSITVSGGTDVVIDITQMFGSTIADYVYSLETATAGAGVSWLRQYFPQFFDAEYLPYNAGSLVSVSGLVSHNQYDADSNLIKSYPLDSSLILRGILKLDSGNKPYFDGDEYAPNGAVRRKMVQVTLNGSESWRASASGNSVYYATKIGDLNSAVSGVCICDKYESTTISGSTTAVGVDVINSSTFDEARIAIRPADVANVSLAKFKAQLAANPVTAVYELVTPTTETAEPYIEEQICEAGGTAQFVVDASAGVIPGVGNVSLYVASLKNKLANMPSIPSLAEPLNKTLVLNGTEDWTLGTSYTNVQRFDLAGAFKDYTDTDHPRGVATVSKGVWTQEATFAGITELSLCFAYGTSPKLYVLVPKSENITTVEAFKAWLASENITVEYAASGDYVLGATIQNGVATYAWKLT